MVIQMYGDHDRTIIVYKLEDGLGSSNHHNLRSLPLVRIINNHGDTKVIIITSQTPREVCEGPGLYFRDDLNENHLWMCK